MVGRVGRRLTSDLKVYFHRTRHTYEASFSLDGKMITAVVQKTQSQPVTPRIPVNIQDILKSQNTGVGKSANSGIINIPGKSTNDSSKLSVSEGGVDLEELRRKAQVKQADIEKKLADLKNRVKT